MLVNKCFSWKFLAVAIASALTAVSTSSLSHNTNAEKGLVQFDVTCDESSQQAMNVGVAQLHNMMYLEAEDIFKTAAEKNNNCAMLHWGVSMTRFHPLWPGQPSGEDIAIGTAAIQHALATGGETDRENAYIKAAAAFYQGSDTPWKERIASWSAQQEIIMNEFPDDVDAKALFALSHLATADKSDKTLKHQLEAGEILEKLHADNPKHPAGFHYLIHAYDNPKLASRATEASQAYDKLAPEVPHALHMPTHIFTRMGMWGQSIDWNRRSADAAVAQATPEMTSSHYSHAMDYLVYAYLQIGQPGAAADTLQEMLDVSDHQDVFASAYALAASPARIPLELDDWERAAVTPVNEHQAISWEKFPAMTAITEFARGIGAGRSGNAEKSLASVDALAGLKTKLEEQGQGYWATLVHAQQKSVDAWRLFAEGSKDQAIQLMTEAADLEDSLDKHPVTPGAVLPARELLGDMLALTGDHATAIQAYDRALMISPNRARSLKGAMLTSKTMGNDELAQSYKDQLDLLMDTEASGN